jgi:dethiobiotin synthetase
MGKGFFVVGTDTGVGKTTISVGLCAAFAERGVRMAAMKPCETGTGDDAQRLLQATGRELDLSLVNPYRFPLPAAPEVAAKQVNVSIELAPLEAAYRALAKDADLTLVEGAGGLLVPLADGVTMADFVLRLALPVLLVARTRLGTINHSLLSIEVLRQRGLPILGVIFSRTRRQIGPEEGDTIETIVRHAKVRSFGMLPFLSPTARTDTMKIAAAIEKSIAVDELLTALRS